MPTNDLFVGMSIDEFIKLVRSSVKEEVERLLKGISDPHSDELMNLQETADFLQVSKVTVHKWKKEKLIKSYRIGRKLYFKRNELSESMNNSLLQPKRV